MPSSACLLEFWIIWILTSKLYIFYNIPIMATITVPADIVLTEGTQTINGAKTFTSPTSFTSPNTNIPGVTLSTTGGTPAVLNYYEEAVPYTNTTSGAFAVSYTVYITRIGNLVNVRFPSLIHACSNSRLFLTTAGNWPAKWRPANTTTWNISVNNPTVVQGEITYDTSTNIWIVALFGNIAFAVDAIGSGYSSDLSITYQI
jgi:hypothetical protein